jgi:hypothetical protein
MLSSRKEPMIIAVELNELSAGDLAGHFAACRNTEESIAAEPGGYRMPSDGRVTRLLRSSPGLKPIQSSAPAFRHQISWGQRSSLFARRSLRSDHR